MPEVWKKCVSDLIKQGKSESSSYAICTAQYKKKYGKNPTHMSVEDYDKALNTILMSLTLEDLDTMTEEDIQAMVEGDIQEYNRNFEMPKKVMFCISEGIKLADDDFEKSKNTTIQVLRAGKFEHPEYGTIAFDEDTFKSFIKNFGKGIPQDHIAYDFKHRPDWGAAAWLKKLHSKDDKLFADVELTPRGFRSLKDKEFIYFSTEYNEAYKDRETGKIYGPTVLGGGLTNRPFIKGMMPVVLSEDGETVFSPVLEEKRRKTEKKEMDSSDNKSNSLTANQNKEVVMLKKLQEKVNELKTKIAALTDGDKGIQKEELHKLQEMMKSLSETIAGLKAEDLGSDDDSADEKLEEIKERVISLTDRVGKIKADDKNGLEKIEKFNKRLEIFEKKLGDINMDETKILAEQNAELKATVKTLQEGNKTLGDSIRKLQERDESSQKKIYADGVKTFAKELSDQGFWPGLVKEITAVLEAYDGKDSLVVKLSEEVIEGTTKKIVEHKLSLQDIINRILSAIPTDSRITTTEMTKGAEKTTALGVEEIEEMASKRKLSYGEMIVELSKDPKYRDRLGI
jgi:hypothetical protein